MTIPTATIHITILVRTRIVSILSMITTLPTSSKIIITIAIIKSSVSRRARAMVVIMA